MAVLKQIKLGELAHDIAKTVVNGTGVVSVTNTKDFSNEKTEEKDYSYDIDVNVDNSTIVKSGNKLAVGTVPAAQVSVVDEGGKLTATNVEAALAELDDKITSTGNAAKKYKVVSVDSPAGTSLAEYKLQVAEGTSETYADVTGSANIVVPKDQHLKDVVLVNQRPAKEDESGPVSGNFLKFTYALNNGTESDVYVDVSAFLSESEFGDGLEVSNAGVVSVKLGQGLKFGDEAKNKSINVKIDSDSESFLTVGDNGVKLTGVQNAINAKVAALDVTDDNVVEGQYVAAIQETDGIVSVKERANVSEAVLKNYTKGSDASAVAASDTINQAISKLENQVDAAKAATTAAIEALDVTDVAVDGQVVTAVSETDGKVSSTKAGFAGIKLGGFAQDADVTGEIASSDTLAAALNKLENKINAAADDHTVVEHATNNKHVTVSGTPNGKGGTTYTVTEDDIASAKALTNEIERAQNAEKEIADKVGLSDAEGSRKWTPTTNYGGSTTSVKDNMQALDTQLKKVTDDLAAVQYQVSGTTLVFFGISPKTV